MSACSIEASILVCTRLVICTVYDLKALTAKFDCKKIIPLKETQLSRWTSYTYSSNAPRISGKSKVVGAY